MFGSGFGSGFGQAGHDDDGVIDLNPGPGGPVGGGAEDAGAANPQQLAPPQAIIAELDQALQHARTAQHRLLDVPLGTIPADQVSGLTETFSTIQANVADVVERATAASNESQLIAVNRDAQEVTEQIQRYVEAVEGTLTEHGISVPSRPSPSAGPQLRVDPANLALLGAAAVGVGVIGVALWQMNKRKKAAAKEERAAARRKRR